jgi:hypothetical protein
MFRQCGASCFSIFYVLKFRRFEVVQPFEINRKVKKDNFNKEIVELVTSQLGSYAILPSRTS